jgi:hypothetical protein
MSTALPLPPSARDFTAYSRIVVDSATTRAVADELKISQTRVRQVVKRVCDWMHQSLPNNTEAEDAGRIRVAQHIAADRLQHFYCEANRLWHQTGEMKYANLAIKVMLAQTKLPALPGTLEALALDAIYGPLPNDPYADLSEPVTPPSTPTRRASEDQTLPTTDISASPTTSSRSVPPSLHPSVPSSSTPHSELRTPHSLPPPRDCSPSQQLPPTNDNQSPTLSSVTPPLQTLSAAPPDLQRAVRRAFLHPAHQPLDTGDSTTPTELKITPQSRGLNINTSLNRSQRRRLRRLASTSHG